MIAAALAYASRLGLSIIPVASDCRTPLVGPTEDCRGGVHRASADPAEIGVWWREWPNANIAAASGPVSGLLVLDVDSKNGKDGFASLSALEQEHGPLPTTWRDSTPSGGGHFYFRHPADRAPRNRTCFRPGLDLKAAGGLITLPPSKRPDGQYSWLVHPLRSPLAAMPPWLLDLVDPPQPARPPVPAVTPQARAWKHRCRRSRGGARPTSRMQ